MTSLLETPWVRLLEATGKKNKIYEQWFAAIDTSHTKKGGWMKVRPLLKPDKTPSLNTPPKSISWRCGPRYSTHVPCPIDETIAQQLSAACSPQTEDSTPQPSTANPPIASSQPGDSLTSTSVAPLEEIVVHAAGDRSDDAAIPFSQSPTTKPRSFKRSPLSQNVLHRALQPIRLAWSALWCCIKGDTFVRDQHVQTHVKYQSKFCCKQEVTIETSVLLPPTEPQGRAKHEEEGFPCDTKSVPDVKPTTRQPGPTSKHRAALQERFARFQDRIPNIANLPVLYLPDILPNKPSKVLTTAEVRALLHEEWPQAMIEAGYHGETRGQIRVAYDIDHLIPRRVGGINHWENYGVMPSSMNRSFSWEVSKEKEVYLGKDLMKRVTTFFQTEVATAATKALQHKESACA